jgi:hypothetical protein
LHSNCYTLFNVNIVIFIIIGKTRLSEPLPASEYYATLHPVSTSFDIATIIFLQSKVLALRTTPDLDDEVAVFMFPSDRVAKLYPEARGSLFVAFYDLQGYGDIIPYVTYKNE